MNIAYSTPIRRQNKPGRPKLTHFIERDKYDEDDTYGKGVDMASADPEPELA